MEAQKSTRSEPPADSSAGNLLRQLGGTVIETYKEWQLTLASNANLADVIWRASRVAWKPPIVPTAAEMLRFEKKIATILTVDDDKRGNIFRRVTFRTRPQPLILMRLLSEHNLEIGPWLTTLVAAVHAGAAEAVREWAAQRLTIVGAQGAVDFELQREDTFVLLRQATKAADLFVCDLEAVASNEYWRKIPRAYLTERVNTLPDLPHRDVAVDWWRNIVEHYDQFEMPLYRLGQRIPKGIEIEGHKISDASKTYSLMTIETFLDRVGTDFLEPLKNQSLSRGNRDILALARTRVQRTSDESIPLTLATAIERARKNILSGSRVVALDWTENIAGLIMLGTCQDKDGISNSIISSLCWCVSGTKCNLSTEDPIVCVQTSVGLFIPFLPETGMVEISPQWHLQALRLDQLSDGTALTYAMTFVQNFNCETAGLGPFINRSISKDDAISGVVTVASGILEALCLIRGELTVANFSRILANFLTLKVLPPSRPDIDSDLSTLDDDLLTFSYITPDIILRSIKRAEVCIGDEEHRILIMAGSNLDWQMLSLAVVPGIAVYQGSGSVTSCIQYANEVGAPAIIAGWTFDLSIVSP